jgi:hypothetical protein
MKRILTALPAVGRLRLAYLCRRWRKVGCSASIARKDEPERGIEGEYLA